MKKSLALLLALVMCLSLTACGGSKNIEKFCDGDSITWDDYEGQHNDTIKYYATFKDGTLTIEKREAKASSSSPTGKMWPVVETKEYSYTLEGNDTVTIDGETYTYEIINDGTRVEFNKDLMGISNYWKK